MSDINEFSESSSSRMGLESKKPGQNGERRWYVIHTYSGHENKVQNNIMKACKNQNLEDYIFQVVIPTEEVEVEVKKKKKKKKDSEETELFGEEEEFEISKKTMSRKLFPGYVFVNMIYNDTTWYIIRNTRGVTGFVGPNSELVPLTEEEIRNLGLKLDSVAADEAVDFEVGDEVNVISGAFEGSEGVIKSINTSKKKATLEFFFFGRSTSVELAFSDIQKKYE